MTYYKRRSLEFSLCFLVHSCVDAVKVIRGSNQSAKIEKADDFEDASEITNDFLSKCSRFETMLVLYILCEN